MGQLDDIQIRRMNSAHMAGVCDTIGLGFADNPSTLANVHGDRAKGPRHARGCAGG